MIVGIDHVVLLCPSIDVGSAVYEILLGRTADWRTQDSAGSAAAFFQLDQTGIELLAPSGEGPLADRLHQLLAQDGPGLQTLVFASSNLEADHRNFTRRALQPEAIVRGESTDPDTRLKRQWRRFRISDARSGGMRTFVLERSEDDPLQARPAAASALTALDHLVITTQDPERAVALYGARLGLTMNLDWSNPAQDSRLLTFSAGTAGIEVAHRVPTASAPGPDRLWGVTWRTPNIEAAHARLAEQGLNLSAIRQGMRRGTRVFTVRDGTLGVPTLIVSNVADEADHRPA